MLFRFRHLGDVRKGESSLSHCVEGGSRWVDAGDLLFGFGFDEFVVYEEADRLFVLPSIGGFKTDE